MLFVPSSSANGFKISDLRKLTQCIIQAAFDTGGFNRVVHSIMKYDLFTVPCPKLNDCTSLWADSLISVKPTETENVEIVFPSMTKCDLGV